ncbi:MAG: hypothetical protein C4522_16100 [Desulfobacteraceae bacterium]|nr:MAG: hypothetical protein C4522_16100 [Desulfobacteraceae bacterium]
MKKVCCRLFFFEELIHSFLWDTVFASFEKRCFIKRHLMEKSNRGSGNVRIDPSPKKKGTSYPPFHHRVNLDMK